MNLSTSHTPSIPASGITPSIHSPIQLYIPCPLYVVYRSIGLLDLLSFPPACVYHGYDTGMNEAVDPVTLSPILHLIG